MGAASTGRSGGMWPGVQQGAALLITLALVAVIGALAVTWMAGTGPTQAQRLQNSAEAMGMIRNALIARAAADLSRPGSLPCPDYNGDGIADGSTCTSPYIGWLPWRTLDLPDLRDARGDRFWYALSQEFRDYAPLGVLNSDTNGSLSVTGPQAATGVVAIVFSPGPPLVSQNRDPSSTDAMTARPQYLDGENSDGDTVYESGPPTATLNDELMLVTRDMLMPAVEQRIARQARRCLENFSIGSGGYYPWAAPLSDVATFNDAGGTLYGRIPKVLDDTDAALGTTGWPQDDPQDPDTAGTEICFQTTFWDSWKELLFYRVAPAFAPDASLPLGCGTSGTCLSVNNVGDVKVVVVVAGRALTGTTPSQATRQTNKTNQQMYLEIAPAPTANVNNAFGLIAGSFGRRPRAITTGPLGEFNDRVECVNETGGPPCD